MDEKHPYRYLFLTLFQDISALHFFFYYFLMFLLPFACNTTNDVDIPSNASPNFVEVFTDASYAQTLDVLGHTGTTSIDQGWQFSMENPHRLDQPWKISLQYIKDAQTVHITLHDFLWLDQTETAQRAVFTMTQLLIQNQSMISAKYQLHAKTGAISLATDIPVTETVSPEELETAIQHLYRYAQQDYLMLVDALGSNRY